MEGKTEGMKGNGKEEIEKKLIERKIEGGGVDGKENRARERVWKGN